MSSGESQGAPRTVAEARVYAQKRPDRVPAHAERHLADRVRPERASPPAWSPSACGCSPGIAFIVGSIMDTLDGRYSRMSGKGTPFGAFLDSTLDRVEEGLVLTAVGVLLRRRSATHSPLRPWSSPC